MFASFQRWICVKQMCMCERERESAYVQQDATCELMASRQNILTNLFACVCVSYISYIGLSSLFQKKTFQQLYT